MFCSKCGKEIADEMSICPECGGNLNSSELNAGGEQNTTGNQIAEIERELAALNSEEILLNKQEGDIKNKKRDVEKALKTVRKHFKRSKSYKAKLNVFAALFIIIVLGCGVSIGNWIFRTANANYSAEIKLLDQKLGQEFSQYEKQFIASLAQERKAQVTSAPITSSDKSVSNEYISSLYRHPSNRLELHSHKGKEYYQATDAISFDKYNLLDSANNAIFPGAIIKGDSLFTNDYTVISTNQTPISIISNQENGKTVQIANPSYSSVTTALNNYASDYSGNLAKEWEYNLQSVSSTRELNASLGIGVKNLSLDLGAGAKESQSTNTIVYSQTYYSVSMEPMSNAADYFADGVDLQILGENEPAYVSSVSYGRKIILIVSSDMSQKDLSAKLSANIKGVSIGAGIESVLKDETLKCQLLSYGGKDISAILDTREKDIGVIGNFKSFLWGSDADSSGLGERLNAFLSEPGTLINPVPLSYTLKYLSDNSVVPPMFINKESIMLADSAQYVSLSFDGTKKNSFIIDTANIPALLLNRDSVSLQDEKAEGSHFELLWNSAYELPITLTYEGREYPVDLNEYDNDKKILIPVSGNSIFAPVGNIEIYKTNPENAIK